MFIFNEISEKGLPLEIQSKNVFNMTLEIRYDLNSIPGGVLIGALYNDGYFKENYDRPRQTAVSFIPPVIRQQEPNLSSAIDLLLARKDGTFQIGAGSGVLGLYLPDFKYTSWENAFSEMNRILDVINSILPSIKNRIGVRFINFFSNQELLNSLKLNCKVFDKNVLMEPFSLTCVNKIEEDTEMRLTLTNPVALEQPVNADRKEGFVIDIDVITRKKMDGVDTIKKVFNQNHLFAKRAFFGLFDKNTIKTVLKPEDKKTECRQ